MPTKTLAPQYDPSAIEADTYQRWLDAGVFNASADSTKEPYVIVIPPPNVTAILHTGHGLNNTLQDALIQFGTEGTCWDRQPLLWSAPVSQQVPSVPHRQAV